MSEEQKTAKEQEIEAAAKAAEEKNKAITGVGMRWRTGQTRGKNPMVISWLAFDDSKPETLPKSIEEFMNVTEKNDEKDLVQFLVTGINTENYISASDPLAEFVENVWPADAQTQFRLVVRNYSRGAGVSLDDAVALIKPGFIKQFGKDDDAVKAAESTEPAATVTVPEEPVITPSA
jgi:hypothetical protein